MRTLQRLVPIVAVALCATSASAVAAPPSRGPVATVRAYVDAFLDKDVARACTMLDAGYWGDDVPGCRDSLRAEAEGARLRARIEPGALVRGARARVVLDLVGRPRWAAPWTARARVLLRHTGGRWQIRQTGPLPGIGLRSADRTPRDVAPPRSAGAALRRLADDELLAVSGNEWMLCDLLAPGAPLGARDGGCARAGIAGSLDDLRYDARADRVTIHRTAPDRARLDVALTVREAVRTKATPGWAVRAHRVRQTLHAVRVSGRWRLAKLSRRTYALLGVRPPDDAEAPTATATWPFHDEPSVSEHPVPAVCRRPSEVLGSACPLLYGFAAGGGLVSWLWSDAGQVLARPVAAGRAIGAVASASPRQSAGGSSYWVPEAVAPVAGGALVLERNLSSRGDVRRAVPAGPDGRPRGVARPLAQDEDVEPDGADADRPARVVPGPPGAATATVLLPSGQVVRLDADGRRVGVGATIAQPDIETRLLARPDGTLLAIGDDGPGTRMEIRALTADARPAGTIATQPRLPGTDVVDAAEGATSADGRVLVAWIEVDARGRGTLRAWAPDPAAPSASAPVAIGISRARDPDGYAGPGDQALAVDALPGGGWGIAWRWAPQGGGSELWAARLDAAGAFVAGPRRVTSRLGATALGGSGFGLAGDTVAYIEAPAIAGLPQVRAAPLP